MWIIQSCRIDVKGQLVLPPHANRHPARAARHRSIQWIESAKPAEPDQQVAAMEKANKGMQATAYGGV